MNLAVFLKQVKIDELLLPFMLKNILKLNGITTMKQLYGLFNEYETKKKITSAVLSTNSNPKLRDAEHQNRAQQLHTAVKTALRTNGVLKAEQVVPMTAPVALETERYDYRKATPVTKASTPKPVLITTDLSQVQLQNATQARLAEVLAGGMYKLPNFTDITELKKLQNEFIERKEVLDLAYQKLNEALSKLDVVAIAERMKVATLAHTKILVMRAENAFKINYDLDIPQWKSHLLTQLNKPELITITPQYSGDRTTRRITVTSFIVDIEPNLKTQLGTIEDYGDAVRATRDMLNYGHKMQGPLASHLWFRRLWLVAREGQQLESSIKPGIRQSKVKEKAIQKKTEDLAKFYWDIMRNRLEQMASKAPYWYLLNYGSASAKTISKGGGGFAAPLLSPTYFVDKAEKQIAAKLLSEFNSASQKGNLLISDLRLRLASVEKKLSANIEIINLLDILIVGLGRESIEVVYNTSLTMAITKINVAFANAIIAAGDNTRLKETVENRVMEFANQILANENTGKRISLFTQQKIRYRYRTVNLAKDIAEEIKGMIPKDKTVDIINRAKQRVAEIQRELTSVRTQVK
jgi:hypothetical protein